MNPSTAILSTAYFPNIQYISKFVAFDELVLEQFENYQKQSYRNRCVIYGANGPMTLVVPVKKNSGTKTSIKEVLIDYDLKWQHQHWNSIYSAYKNSPFFDYYEDDFCVFFRGKEKYLFDLNTKINELILCLLRINVNFKLTQTYAENSFNYDYRSSISPKPRLFKSDELFTAYPYPQVFSDKFGFKPNLSIIDLLFNIGPDSIEIIKKSIQ